MAATPHEIEELYRHRYVSFRRGVTALTGSPEGARDVVQEAFAQALRDRNQYRGQGPWRPGFGGSSSGSRSTPGATAESCRRSTSSLRRRHSFLRSEIPCWPKRSGGCRRGVDSLSSCATSRTSRTPKSLRSARSVKALSRRPCRKPMPNYSSSFPRRYHDERLDNRRKAARFPRGSG